MPNTIALVTGASGEIGRSLLRVLALHGGYDLVSLDLVPPGDDLRGLVRASYVCSIAERSRVDEVAAHHEFDTVFHLAALLSARGEADPELAHQINVEGTRNVLRVAQSQSRRRGQAVRFVFPSSIAVYGLPSPGDKHAAGRVREEQWNLPTTMYGCNKLYCEHLGRYLSFHARPPGVDAEGARLDFRALRFPGLMSAETEPAGGTSDFGPEMIHAAARGEPYVCFVEPETRLPFMAMPDAVRALLTLERVERPSPSSCVYNVGAFSLSAAEIAERVEMAFPGTRIAYRPDPVRARIAASWPEDVDDSRARAEWGWRPEYDWGRAFDDYLAPGVRGLHRA